MNAIMAEIDDKNAPVGTDADIRRPIEQMRATRRDADHADALHLVAVQHLQDEPLQSKQRVRAVQCH